MDENKYISQESPETEKKKTETEKMIEKIAEKKRFKQETQGSNQSDFSKATASGDVPVSHTFTSNVSTPKKVKVMKSGTPVIVAVIVWIIIAMIFQFENPVALVIAAVVAFLIFLLLNKRRKKQLDKLPPEPAPLVFSQEVSANLNSLKNKILDRAKSVTYTDTKEVLGSIAITLGKMAEKVEDDPKDGNKVRKLANHYQDMILELIDKYLDFESQESVAVEGGNIDTSLLSIRQKLKEVDSSLKKTLDDMFRDDSLLVNADLSALDALMNLKNEALGADETVSKKLKDIQDKADNPIQ